MEIIYAICLREILWWTLQFKDIFCHLQPSPRFKNSKLCARQNRSHKWDKYLETFWLNYWKYQTEVDVSFSITCVPERFFIFMYIQKADHRTFFFCHLLLLQRFTQRNKRAADLLNSLCTSGEMVQPCLNNKWSLIFPVFNSCYVPGNLRVEIYRKWSW